mgnify:CR=1 FL=1
MKRMKKLFALLMTLAMVMGLSITGFATENTNTDGIKVYGVEAENGVTVTAYQIIRYDTSGKYVPVIDGTITADNQGNLTPTASDVLGLSTKLDELTTSQVLSLVIPTEEGADPYYTYEPAEGEDNLAPGTWMIIVTGSNDYIYNPAIISINQTADGVKYGELNLDTDSWGTGVWMKKSEPTIEKTALTPDVKGVQYGDIIQFQIKTRIPSYASNKTDITYTIKDSLDGLALVVDGDHPVVATLGGESDTTLTNFVKAAFTNKASNVTVAITGDDYIKSHGNKEIVITYYAEVTEDAKYTVNELTNDATLTYSKGTGTETASKTDDTKHYTFGIDTTFSGATQVTDKTGEFIKIDANGNVSYTEKPGEVTVAGGQALNGAVFELHVGSATGTLFEDASGATRFTTNEDGRLEIVGLDSDVDYYLVEVQAPTGYSINNTPVKVRVNATYDDEGNLTNYSVTIGEGDGAATTNYNYSYENGKTTVAEEVGNPYGFKNTTLSALPSTGGMGTTLFTIAGCVIMISAAGLFFATRKKAN